MVKYLIYNTKSQAYDRSREIALSLGAGDSADDITKYWFGVIEHPSGEGALEVPEEETGKLTQAEQALLKDRTFMENQGWFN
jgi:hypothetical protein